jgi:hypothetical protein
LTMSPSISVEFHSLELGWLVVAFQDQPAVWLGTGDSISPSTVITHVMITLLMTSSRRSGGRLPINRRI